MANKDIVKLAIKREDLSPVRQNLYSQVLKEIASLNIDLKRPTDSEIDKYFFWLKNKNFTQNTRITKWRIFCKATNIICPNHKIIFRKWKFKDPKPDQEVLTLEEVSNMANAAKTPRDKVLILVLYESGIRPGELQNLTKSDIEFDDHGALLHIDGKTGKRIVRITQSVEPLWHYVSILQSDKLWNIQNFAIIKMIRDTARRAGIKKKVSPYTFRHSRVTHLLPYITEATAKVYFGWSPNTKMLKQYNHLTGHHIDRQIISAQTNFSLMSRDPLDASQPFGQTPPVNLGVVCGSKHQDHLIPRFLQAQFSSGLKYQQSP